jgi:hypothetical protein
MATSSAVLLVDILIILHIKQLAILIVSYTFPSLAIVLSLIRLAFAPVSGDTDLICEFP